MCNYSGNFRGRTISRNNATYFGLALIETDEKVHVGVKSEYASMVKPNAKLFYEVEPDKAIGYTQWNNGIGPLGIQLP